MGQLQALALGGEDDAVLAGRVAAAQGGETDIAGASRPRHAVAHLLRHCAQLDPPPRGGGPAERQRRARGGIDLVAMVHFENLDVVVGAERRAHLLHQGQQKIHAEAHIGGLHDGRLGGGGGQGGLVLGFQSRGADHVDRPGRFRQAGMDQQRRRRGEIDHRVGRGKQGRRVVADREALGPDPGEVAEVLADHWGAREFRAAGKRAAVRLVDDARHHAAHAAGTADDADPERLHIQPLPWGLP